MARDPSGPPSPPDASAGVIHLSCGQARAGIALAGAEPVSWWVAGRELIWGADPVHWPRHAPILFPVIGASSGGAVRVGGRAYPMPRHGFARDASFALVERAEASARLRLTDSAATRLHYPYPFRLDLVAELSETSLALALEVSNPGADALPYSAGFHPAFPWPFDGAEAAGHEVVFEAEEDGRVPLVTPEGLLREERRAVPIEGRRLALEPRLFEEDALVFLDARGRALRFASPSGAAIELRAENMPHLALWTKPGAPFLSLEAWTGHADPEGFAGDLSARPSIRLLPPGGTARHAVTLAWHPGGRGAADGQRTTAGRD